MGGVSLEERASLRVLNSEVLVSLKVNKNIPLVNQNYNRVRKPESAVAIEWQIKGEEVIRVFLAQLAPRFPNNLYKVLKDRLKSEVVSLGEKTEMIKNADRGIKVPIEDRINVVKDEEKDVKITIKWGGKYRVHYPTVNIVIPLTECKHMVKRYQWHLKFNEAIEVVYKAIFWISASELSESKGLNMVRVVFGKEFQDELGNCIAPPRPA